MSLYYPREFFQYFHDQASFHQRRYAAEASFLADIIHDCRKPRLLDIGCASGEFPRFMQRFGWDVEGVEIADAQIQLLIFRSTRVSFPISALMSLAMMQSRPGPCWSTCMIRRPISAKPVGY